VRVNAKWLDALPQDLQALVRTSATEVFAEQRKVNRANAARTLDQLKAAGVTVHTLQDGAAWQQTTARLFDEFGAKSPATKAMIGRIRALAA
jgi:TRAP-type transport system periplasmic protein